jgi:hypothetical protein
MLTHRHRALFEASYSALLLRSDPKEQTLPPRPPDTDAGQTARSKGDKEFGNDAKLDQP